MCSTGVILSIPLYSLLSQKHNTLFSVWETEGGVSFVPLLDPDTNLEDLEPQGPNVWELPSPQGTQTEKWMPRGCLVWAGCLPGAWTTSIEMKGGWDLTWTAGAYTVIWCKLWPKICHVKTDIVWCTHNFYQNHQNIVDIDPLASNLTKPHVEMWEKLLVVLTAACRQSDWGVGYWLFVRFFMRRQELHFDLKMWPIWKIILVAIQLQTAWCTILGRHVNVAGMKAFKEALTKRTEKTVSCPYEPCYSDACLLLINIFKLTTC